MKKTVLVFLMILFCHFSNAQNKVVYESEDLANILQPAKHKMILVGKAELNNEDNNFSRLFSVFGNLNLIKEDIPLGDFHVSYDYTVATNKKDAAIGMSYGTFNEQTEEFFTFSFMLTGQRELKYYFGKAKEFYSSEKMFITEKCDALMPFPAKNNITIDRIGRKWSIIVNSDTVKTVVEPAYGIGNNQINEPAPLMKPYSNLMLLKGKQEVVFTNSSQKFYLLQTEFSKAEEFLSTLYGNYVLKPECTIGSADKDVNVKVVYFSEGNLHRVCISGITSETKYYYLTFDSSTGMWKCKMDEPEYITSEGKKYEIKQIVFKKVENPDRILMGFQLTSYTTDYSANTESGFNCVYTGFKED